MNATWFQCAQDYDIVVLSLIDRVEYVILTTVPTVVLKEYYSLLKFQPKFTNPYEYPA